ncbi:GapR family DNA-binding domain-containing protein [Holospora elegans]|nr:GapR family DNA-binding domain-containing protein [Holospora elegans]
MDGVMIEVSGKKLKQYIEELEQLEERRIQVVEETKEVLADAKGEGFDIKIIKKVLQIRRMKPEKFSEQEALLQTYIDALLEETS